LPVPASERRPGRPARLSREALVETAESIIERHGIEAHTMRRLADELGSSTMALYRHVRDKDELLVLLIDRRAAELARGPLPVEPRDRLLALFGLLYDGWAQNPWIVDVLVKGDLIAPSVLWVIDEILAAFIAAGLDPERAAVAYTVAWRYSIGEFVVRHATAVHLARLEREPIVRAVLRAVDPVELPTLASLAIEVGAGREGGGEYADGLRAVIDGLLGWAER
jgi:AcrR family transcriptional regulator